MCRPKRSGAPRVRMRGHAEGPGHAWALSCCMQAGSQPASYDSNHNGTQLQASSTSGSTQGVAPVFSALEGKGSLKRSSALLFFATAASQQAAPLRPHPGSCGQTACRSPPRTCTALAGRSTCTRRASVSTRGSSSAASHSLVASRRTRACSPAWSGAEAPAAGARGVLCAAEALGASP